MSDDHGTRGVHVSSGEGIVAHLSNLTAFATGDETRLNELLVRLNALKDAPWHEVVRTLTAGIVDADYDLHPDLACVSIGENRVSALVFGDTSLTITTDQTTSVLNGRDSSTWIDVAVHGAVDRVQGGQQSSSIIVGVLRDGVVPAGGFLLDTAGPMPSSTRWVETDVSISPDPAPDSFVADVPSGPPPVPQPSEGPLETSAASEADAVVETATDVDEEPIVETEPDEVPHEDSREEADRRPLAGIFARLDQRHREEQAIDPPIEQAARTVEAAEEGGSPADATSAPLDAPPMPAATNGSHSPAFPAAHDTSTPPANTSTLAPSRPKLRGILCPNGHLTQPNDVRCRTCDEATDPDATVVLADRPTLGRLTFDDGAILSIDRPAAIGSAVPAGYEIDGEPATVVRLDDGLDGVSPLQVEVRTVGWDVEIHDMNSENGTYTILRGERQTRTRLRGGQSVVLQDGMMVEVGGRSFTFSVGETVSDNS